MNIPIFSCVVPVKGPRPYFDEAVASLRNQGLGDALEIIVQDGDVESDKGQSDALNKGFAKANGEWLFWLNADDVLLPGALKKVLDKIDNIDRLDWLAGNTIYIDKEDKVIGTRWDARWLPWFGNRMSVWTGGPSAFFRKELWQAHGRLDTGLKFVMDLDLWTRWARAGIRFESLDDYVWGFRVHEESATNKTCNRREIAQEFQDVLRRHDIRHEKLWRNITRFSSILDGSRWHKMKDSLRFRGKALFDCAGGMA